MARAGPVGSSPGTGSAALRCLGLSLAVCLHPVPPLGLVFRDSYSRTSPASREAFLTPHCAVYPWGTLSYGRCWLGIWGCAQDSAFLAISSVMLMLLVYGPHLRSWALWDVPRILGVSQTFWNSPPPPPNSSILPVSSGFLLTLGLPPYCSFRPSPARFSSHCSLNAFIKC